MAMLERTRCGSTVRDTRDRDDQPGPRSSLPRAERPRSRSNPVPREGARCRDRRALLNRAVPRDDDLRPDPPHADPGVGAHPRVAPGDRAPARGGPLPRGHRPRDDELVGGHRGRAGAAGGGHRRRRLGAAGPAGVLGRDDHEPAPRVRGGGGGAGGVVGGAGRPRGAQPRAPARAADLLLHEVRDGAGAGAVLPLRLLARVRLALEGGGPGPRRAGPGGRDRGGARAAGAGGGDGAGVLPAGRPQGHVPGGGRSPGFRSRSRRSSTSPTRPSSTTC